MVWRVSRTPAVQRAPFRVLATLPVRTRSRALLRLFRVDARGRT